MMAVMSRSEKRSYKREDAKQIDLLGIYYEKVI